MRNLCIIAILLLAFTAGAQTLPKPLKVPKSPKQASKGWHWEKNCPECGKSNHGVDRISGFSAIEVWHSVAFTCKCGHGYTENYTVPKMPDAPMFKVIETKVSAEPSLMPAYKSPKQTGK